MNIIGKRYWFFGLSLLIIIPGIIALALGGLRPSIDFTGGTMLEILFNSGKAPTPDEIRTALENVSIAAPGEKLENIQIQTLGADGIVLRVQQIDQATIDSIIATLSEAFDGVTLNMADNVGAAVGGEVAQRAAGAVALAAIGIALYVWFAFRKLPNASRYGMAAVFSLVHDVLVLLGLEAILGLVLGWEADALFLTALLTVIGFSVHDTIVVFDRIRENRVKHKYAPFETVVNHSIVQTLDRSIRCWRWCFSAASPPGISLLFSWSEWPAVRTPPSSTRRPSWWSGKIANGKNGFQGFAALRTPKPDNYF
jgi:preprotein translocase subunit SecF